MFCPIIWQSSLWGVNNCEAVCLAFHLVSGFSESALHAFVYNTLIFLIKIFMWNVLIWAHSNRKWAHRALSICLSQLHATKWLAQELAERFSYRSTVVQSYFGMGVWCCMCVSSLCARFLMRGTILWSFCSIRACEKLVVELFGPRSWNCQDMLKFAHGT